MDKSAISLLYEYTIWANQRIFTAAQTLPPAELTRPRTVLGETIFAKLTHLIGAEWTWRMRFQEGFSPASLPQPGDFPNLAAILERWQQEVATMRSFLAGLDDEALEADIRYKNTKGLEFSEPLWQILMHLVTHATQHRSEVAVFLTESGASPGDLDLILYLRSL